MLPRAHTRRVALATAVIAACALPTAARGDAVTDWNSAANAGIFSTNRTAHAAVLSTAMVRGAEYDAANAIASGYRP
jgi:hypothetical protein